MSTNPPARVAAYLRKVALMPTPELRQFAHRWRGEPLGRYAEDVLKGRRDIGGPVTPGPSMPMMAGDPNLQFQRDRLENLPIEQLRELAYRLAGTMQGATVQAILDKRKMMPHIGGAAPPPPVPDVGAQAGFGSAPQPTVIPAAPEGPSAP